MKKNTIRKKKLGNEIKHDDITIQDNKTKVIVSIIVGFSIIIAVLYLIFGNISLSTGAEGDEGGESQTQTTQQSQTQTTQNVEIRDGIQYVSINAKNGYTPRISRVQPDIPTKLIVKTNRTYDCSAVLNIREINFQKTLQPTGEEIVDLGTFKKGSRITGTCGMGMYYFEIRSS